MSEAQMQSHGRTIMKIPGIPRLTAAQAIDFLMPQLPQRARIREMLLKMNKCRSYFATISMDITNIILTLVPGLRHRHTESAFDDTRVALDQFVKKYATEHTCAFSDWEVLSKKRLGVDFQHVAWEYESTRVKFVRGCLHFQDASTIKEYVANNVFIILISDEGFVVDQYSKSIHPCPQFFNDYPFTPVYHGLPCGLIIIEPYGYDYWKNPSITNIHTGQSVIIYDSYQLYKKQIMDDFGNVTSCNVSDKLWNFSEFTTMFAEFTINDE